MGRELQKRKNRSSLHRVRQKPKSKKVQVKGNAIVAANWDQSQTLTQNYRRLGLTARLNAMTGGDETFGSEAARQGKKDSLGIENAKLATEIEPGTARVERGEDGRILRVIHNDGGKQKRDNPLGDPLNELEDEGEEDEVERGEDGEAEKGIVPELRAQAKSAAARPKKPRKPSAREGEWIERLVERWGEDYKGMSRDRRLNAMQQSEGDLRRRIRRWRELGVEGQAV